MIAFLTWNINTEGDFNKYKVYYGPADGVYTGSQEVVGATNFFTTITGLPDGVPVYFAITGIDNGANESAKSSSVSIANKYLRLL